MKKIFLLSLILFTQMSFAKIEVSDDYKFQAIGQYGIHLFFNEKEFVDIFQIFPHYDGELYGHMHVPNDFDGDTSKVAIDGLKIEFDLFVPKNESRPKDLMFHYVGEFFNSSYDQLKGFVTLKGEKNFVASFVGFKRQSPELEEQQ